MSSKPRSKPQRQLSNAEQETQTAAVRLNGQVEAALSSVAINSAESADELETHADRIERAARDLSVALRELACQRRSRNDE